MTSKVGISSQKVNYFKKGKKKIITEYTHETEQAYIYIYKYIHIYIEEKCTFCFGAMPPPPHFGIKNARYHYFDGISSAHQHSAASGDDKTKTYYCMKTIVSSIEIIQK